MADKGKYFGWAVVALWMALIFFLSHQPSHESAATSRQVTQIIVEVAERVAPKVDVDMKKADHIVRKNAHFFAYLALGVLVSCAMDGSGVKGSRGALAICLLYAIGDEIHQIYVPGRGAQLLDVMIDGGGASVGIWIYMGIRDALSKNKRGVD